MSEPEIQRAPTDAEIEELRERLIEFNVSKHGYTDVSKMGVFIRDDGGALEAGVYAYGWGGVLEVELLWVSESARGRGLGSRIMRAVEDEARSLGFSKIVLDTFSFQAPGFYEKLGFRITSTIDNFPEGHSHYLLVKELSP